jgi:hypothetical protein
MKIVYSAVRNVSFNKAVCASSIESYEKCLQRGTDRVCVSDLKGQYILQAYVIITNDGGRNASNE